MITELIQILKSWPIFFQFLFLMLAFYFSFYIISDIVSKTLDFLCNALPVMLRGWPNFEDEAEEAEVEDDQKEKEDEKK